jgi:hypothetical protein
LRCRSASGPPDRTRLSAHLKQPECTVDLSCSGDPLVEIDNIDVLRPCQRSIGMYLCHLEALRARRAERHISTGEDGRPGNVLPPVADA